MDERSTYLDDVYAWSQEQAAVLRGLQQRRDLPNDLDLEHVIEEIECVGSSELHSVQSYLRLIFVHLIKAASTRNHEPQAHWRAEIIGFHNEFIARYSPSMRQNMDVAVLWRRALREAEAVLQSRDEVLAPGLNVSCPFDIDDFVGEEIGVDALLTRAAALRDAEPPIEAGPP